MTWHNVLSADALDEMQGTVVEVDGQQLALFKYDGMFYCIENECKHEGGPLGEGHVEDDRGEPVAVCPWHGWRYEIKTGKNKTMPAPIAHVEAYETKVEEHQVYVKLGTDKNGHEQCGTCGCQ